MCTDCYTFSTPRDAYVQLSFVIQARKFLWHPTRRGTLLKRESLQRGWYAYSLIATISPEWPKLFVDCHQLYCSANSYISIPVLGDSLKPTTPWIPRVFDPLTFTSSSLRVSYFFPDFLLRAPPSLWQRFPTPPSYPPPLPPLRPPRMPPPLCQPFVTEVDLSFCIRNPMHQTQDISRLERPKYWSTFFWVHCGCRQLTLTCNF